MSTHFAKILTPNRLSIVTFFMNGSNESKKLQLNLICIFSFFFQSYYRLNIGSFHANGSIKDWLTSHNGQAFSTKDRDNDSSSRALDAGPPSMPHISLTYEFHKDCYQPRHRHLHHRPDQQRPQAAAEQRGQGEGAGAGGPPLQRLQH